MITPIVKENKIVFGPCRLSYTHVFQKYSFDNNPENGKYMATILIPKAEKETVAAIQKIVEKVKKETVLAKWNGKEPKNLLLPLQDGDAREDEDPNFAGHWYINAKCNTRPGIVDKKKVPIVDEEEIYSGVWCVCSVTFYGFDNMSKGVACGLNNLMKFKDDEHLGGRVSADRDFEDVDMDDDDDL